MKRAAINVSTIIVLSIIVACASKAPPVQTPKALKIWQANEVVVHLGQLQDVAIGLNDIQQCSQTAPTECAPILSDKNTGYVVDAVEVAVKTIQKVPEGYKAAALQALDAIEKQLDAQGKTKMLPYVTVVRQLVTALVPNPPAPTAPVVKELR